MQCNANHNYKKEKGGLEAIKKNQIAMSLKTQKNIGIDNQLYLAAIDANLPNYFIYYGAD